MTITQKTFSERNALENLCLAEMNYKNGQWSSLQWREMIADGSPDMQEEKKVKIENDYKLSFYYILWVGSGVYSPIKSYFIKLLTEAKMIQMHSKVYTIWISKIWIQRHKGWGKA